jgi:hypothetical protein
MISLHSAKGCRREPLVSSGDERSWLHLSFVGAVVQRVGGTDPDVAQRSLHCGNAEFGKAAGGMLPNALSGPMVL